MSSSWLDLYESLDIIGNGSFGIIRKVRRKSDGQIFARKELNFERMSERDRKQIVAEVNILKDLHHDHIVRYHDRFVDKEAGILYILMEYCGGGDLSSVIKQATKHNRPIPEETVWSYFMQILLALQYCHHPSTNPKNGSGTNSNGGTEIEGGERRPQILHRDLKPDNVFLDDSNRVKLGDFGLSKALAQTNFANTYVGTPYYMSPELMQEKAYDSKSDMWSLGCLIYELCASKPPFHEAKTHSELSICIRNGRIPPLPRGYSQSLSSVIKSMLNLNPAMRPSAVQLLQHERLDFAFKVSEMEKMLSIIKGHKANFVNRERELSVRESAILGKEQQLTSVIAQKEAEIASLQQSILQLQQQEAQQYSQHQVEAAVREAVARREEELRELVMKREKEVAEAMARREDEIMEAVRKREADIFQAWSDREAAMHQELDLKVKEIEERVSWIASREQELQAEDARIEDAQFQLEQKMEKWEEMMNKGRKEKTPLEEVKNLVPVVRIPDDTPKPHRKLGHPTPKPIPQSVPFMTPHTRPPKPDLIVSSAMRGVILTATGESLATPAPTELVKLFDNSPKVGLNFAKIFDFESSDEDEEERANIPVSTEKSPELRPPPSPSSRKSKTKSKLDGEQTSDGSLTCSSSSSSTKTASASASTSAVRPTRSRRSSLRNTGSQRDPIQRSITLPAASSSSLSSALGKPSTTSTSEIRAKPLPHPHLSVGRSTTLSAGKRPPPQYDLADEENLPSPFIKRNLARGALTRPVASVKSLTKKRLSGGLRAVAAANCAGKRTALNLPEKDPSTGDTEASDTRPAVVSARKANETTRKVLSKS